MLLQRSTVHSTSITPHSPVHMMFWFCLAHGMFVACPVQERKPDVVDDVEALLQEGTAEDEGGEGGDAGATGGGKVDVADGGARLQRAAAADAGSGGASSRREAASHSKRDGPTKEQQHPGNRLEPDVQRSAESPAANGTEADATKPRSRIRSAIQWGQKSAQEGGRGMQWGAGIIPILLCGAGAVDGSVGGVSGLIGIDVWVVVAQNVTVTQDGAKGLARPPIHVRADRCLLFWVAIVLHSLGGRHQSVLVAH